MPTEDPLPPRTLGDPSADQLPAEAPAVVHPDLAGKLQTIPELPGVYLMRDGRRRVLYGQVGLAALAGPLLLPFRDLSARICWMVRGGVETIVVDSRWRHCSENNLIKRYRPYFNVTATTSATY